VKRRDIQPRLKEIISRRFCFPIYVMGNVEILLKTVEFISFTERNASKTVETSSTKTSFCYDYSTNPSSISAPQLSSTSTFDCPSNFNSSLNFLQLRLLYDYLKIFSIRTHNSSSHVTPQPMTFRSHVNDPTLKNSY